MLNPQRMVNTFEKLKKKRGKLPKFDNNPIVTKDEYALNQVTVQFDKYRDENGKLDAKKFLEDNMEIILMDLLNPGKGIPSRKSEMILKILDIYKEKQEVTQKVEFTVADRQSLSADIIGGLKRERESTGVCPVCGIGQTLLNEPCLYPEPE